MRVLDNEAACKNHGSLIIINLIENVRKRQVMLSGNAAVIG